MRPRFSQISAIWSLVLMHYQHQHAGLVIIWHWSDWTVASLRVNGMVSVQPTHFSFITRCQVTLTNMCTTLYYSRTDALYDIMMCTLRCWRPYIIAGHGLTDHTHTHLLAWFTHKLTPTLSVLKFGEKISAYMWVCTVVTESVCVVCFSHSSWDFDFIPNDHCMHIVLGLYYTGTLYFMYGI